jgi:pimeloyl-ACP methyl ester carboxylesterase
LGRPHRLEHGAVLSGQGPCGRRIERPLHRQRADAAHPALQEPLQGSLLLQLYFQEPGVAEAELEADLRTALRKTYYQASGEGRKDGPRPPKPADAKYLEGLIDPNPFPAWLTAADLDYYVGQFEQSGFRGPLNRYRTAEIDFAQQAEIADRRIEQPAAFIAGQLDPVLAFIPGVDLVEVMRQHVTDLRLVRIIDGAGHWIQQERPAEVNAALLEWLRGIG